MLKNREEPLITKRESQNLALSILVAVCVVPVVYSLSLLVKKYFAIVLIMKELTIMGVWWLVIPFALGGVIVGVIIWNYAPEAEGPGLHVVIAAFTRRDGRLRLRTLPSKYITTLVTVGSGTPSGIVSPSAVLGNSIASCLGRITNIDPDLQKTLSLCGISAALSTLLHTPFGAALFAVEVVYGNYILYKRIVYCLSSSVTAYLFSSFLGIHTFNVEVAVIQPITPQILFFIIVTALIAVFVNILYIHVYQYVHDFFLDRSWKEMNWLKPVVGMVSAAVIMAPFYSLFLRVNIGGGSPDFTALASASVYEILAIIMIIIGATSLISGTGGSGGLFMPVMTIGALVGICVGFLTPSHSVIFMAAGMSAALCTTLNVPLTSAVLSIELFGPVAVLPSIIGSLTGYLLAKKYVIYHEIQWEELKE